MGTQLPLPQKGQSPQFLAHLYCGQTAGWIKMALGAEVDLGPANIVLDGDPTPPPQKRDHSQHRLRPWPHYVRWGPSFPSPKGAEPPIFCPSLLWPNSWMDQDGTWCGGRPWPSQHCARWGPNSPSPEKGAQPSNFWPMSIVAKRLDASRCHLVRW